MSREEQIKKAAHDFSWGWCDDMAHPLNNGFIKGAEWADQHPQWIPVEEELPKCNLVDCGLATYPILVYREDGFIDISRYDSEVGEWDCIGVVTHWMPLPEAPRKED